MRKDENIVHFCSVTPRQYLKLFSLAGYSIPSCFLAIINGFACGIVGYWLCKHIPYFFLPAMGNGRGIWVIHYLDRADSSFKRHKKEFLSCFVYRGKIIFVYYNLISASRVNLTPFVCNNSTFFPCCWKRLQFCCQFLESVEQAIFKTSIKREKICWREQAGLSTGQLIK